MEVTQHHPGGDYIKFKGPIDKGWPFWIWVQHISHMLGVLRDLELKKHGITVMQSAVIIILQNAEPPVRPIDIANQMILKKRYVTELIKAMEKKGIVDKQPDENRKNQINLSLTEKGKQIYDEMIEDTAMHQIMSHFEDEEIDNTIEFLNKVKKRLAKIIGKLYVPFRR